MSINLPMNTTLNHEDISSFRRNIKVINNFMQPVDSIFKTFDLIKSNPLGRGVINYALNRLLLLENTTDLVVDYFLDAFVNLLQ